MSSVAAAMISWPWGPYLEVGVMTSSCSLSLFSTTFPSLIPLSLASPMLPVTCLTSLGVLVGAGGLVDAGVVVLLLMGVAALLPSYFLISGGRGVSSGSPWSSSSCWMWPYWPSVALGLYS